MPTYLLKWDATRWDWRNIREQSEAALNGQPVTRTWTCGTSRRIFPGDRVFVLRVGREPRGIIAAGTVARGSYDSPSNEFQDGARGKGALCVDVKFDSIVEPRQDAGIPRALLGHGALAAFPWDSQSSGAAVPDAVASALEAAWTARGTGGAGSAAAQGAQVAADQEKQAQQEVVAEQERAAAAQAEAERAEQERVEAEQAAKAAVEKAAAARAAADRAVAEKAAAEKAAAEKRAAVERAAAEKAAAQKRAAEEKAAAEKAAAEKLAAEKAAAAKRAAEAAAAKAPAKASSKAAVAKAPTAAASAAVDHHTGDILAPTPPMYPAIVTDYFEMLTIELASGMYSKADHRNRMAKELGLKDPDLVDVAFQQVSAVLLALGMPVVDGFRPLGGYTGALADAVYAHLENNAALLDKLWIRADATKVNVPVELDDSRMVLMPTPLAGDHDPADAPLFHPREPLEVDFRGRESRDEALVTAGQRFVLAYERSRLRETGFKDLVSKIEWVAADRGDALGFHVRSFDESGQPRFIIVKTTNFGARLPFTLRRTEFSVGLEHGAKACVYRVFSFSRGARLFVLPGPFDAKLHTLPLDYCAML
jgi:hypothetical protein